MIRVGVTAKRANHAALRHPSRRRPSSTVWFSIASAMLVLCAAAGGVAAGTFAHPGMAKLALVVDDVGHNSSQVDRVLALPAPITLGVLPHTPAAALAAERAGALGKEVILHQPMQNVSGVPLGPDGLYADLDHAKFVARLDDALAAVPGSRGVSNHTGSLLTQIAEPMDWLMDVLAARRLFFLDSRTTPFSIAPAVARRHGVPAISRDVFLDNDLRIRSLALAFEHAISIARRRGYVVVIAHPHAPTLEFLEQRLPSLAALGVEPVLLSDLLSARAKELAMP